MLVGGMDAAIASMLSAALMLAGCSNGNLNPAERADRSSRSYAAAMAELQAGRVDSAIRGFEEVVRNEPGNGNAHFQLAALLEDAKKDYIGAIVHYRIYQTIRPKSDKAAIAADRMKGCETRYAALIVERAGLDNQFAASLEALRKEHGQCAKREAKISEELDKAKRKIASLERDVEMKRRLIEKASAIADAPSVPNASRKPLRPSDADLLDAGRGRPHSSREAADRRVAGRRHGGFRRRASCFRRSKEEAGKPVRRQGQEEAGAFHPRNVYGRRGRHAHADIRTVLRHESQMARYQGGEQDDNIPRWPGEGRAGDKASVTFRTAWRKACRSPWAIFIRSW